MVSTTTRNAGPLGILIYAGILLVTLTSVSHGASGSSDSEPIMHEAQATSVGTVNPLDDQPDSFAAAASQKGSEAQQHKHKTGAFGPSAAAPAPAPDTTAGTHATGKPGSSAAKSAKGVAPAPGGTTVDVVNVQVQVGSGSTSATFGGTPSTPAAGGDGNDTETTSGKAIDFCRSNEYYDSDSRVCVGFEGAVQTRSLWPCDVMRSGWGACQEFSCNNQVIVGGSNWETTISAKWDGNYGGWDLRNRFMDAAMRSQGGQCGSWHVNGGWYMPRKLWLRDYSSNPEGYINADFF
eukprot:jgi/Botrbrau1/14104/Bobra.182_3s0047.1